MQATRSIRLIALSLIGVAGVASQTSAAPFSPEFVLDGDVGTQGTYDYIPARLRNPGVLFGDGMESCVRPHATCGEGPCRGHVAPTVVPHSLDGGDIGRSICSIRALVG